MAGIASIVFFAVAFVLYAAKSGGSVPWTPEGFSILGLLALAIHLVWPVYPWRHPQP